nr:MAG TPA: hypothetical protein [Caudoviricetes sp.]
MILLTKSGKSMIIWLSRYYRGIMNFESSLMEF